MIPLPPLLPPPPSLPIICLALSILFLLAAIYSLCWLSPIDKPEACSESVHLIGIWAEVSKWSWIWTQRWQGLSFTLPISFSAKDNERVGSALGNGIGVGNEILRLKYATRRPSTEFERPLPALYESNVPLSMAKLIMSRQMQRKAQPPRRPSLPPQRRLQSMV